MSCPRSDRHFIGWPGHPCDLAPATQPLTRRSFTWGALAGMSPEESAYHELCCYTLAHGGEAFIHQHVVDAFAAQDAHERDKPIRLTFALVGLYLHAERRFSGKQVQLAHMALARRRRAWPVFPLPPDRGKITAIDVLGAPEGSRRDEMIHEWCACVWEAFRESRQAVEDLLKDCDVFS